MGAVVLHGLHRLMWSWSPCNSSCVNIKSGFRAGNLITPLIISGMSLTNDMLDVDLDISLAAAFIGVCACRVLNITFFPCILWKASSLLSQYSTVVAADTLVACHSWRCHSAACIAQ